MTVENKVDLNKVAEYAEMQAKSFLSLAHPAQVATTSEAAQVATAHVLFAISCRLAALNQTLKDGLESVVEGA